VGSLRHADDWLMLAVNEFAKDTPWLHAAVLAYASYGVVLFGLLLVLGLLYARHRSSQVLAAAGWAGIATVVAVALNQPVGQRVDEARPYVVLPGLLRLASPTADFSFPSDHCVMAGAVAMGLMLVSRRLGLVAVVLALLMAFSRVYIAAHYPWDVVAGLVFGAGVALLGWMVLRLPLTWATDRLRGQWGLRSLFHAVAPAE
jgi:undecaprenyl-diphosphatase